MIRRTTVIPSVMVFMFFAQTSFGQRRPTSEELQLLRKDVDTIKANQAEIEKSVRELKDLARSWLSFPISSVLSARALCVRHSLKSKRITLRLEN
jgi:hypothetical protein